jgi:hypothetical protein
MWHGPQQKVVLGFQREKGGRARGDVKNVAEHSTVIATILVLFFVPVGIFVPGFGAIQPRVPRLALPFRQRRRDSCDDVAPKWWELRFPFRIDQLRVRVGWNTVFKRNAAAQEWLARKEYYTNFRL